MIRLQHQTEFGEGKGDCLAACVASLLGLDLDDVPNFCGGYTRDDGGWRVDFDEWLRVRGLTAVDVVYDPKILKANFGQLVILTGPSPRGDFLHAVIGIYEDRRWRIYFDPHPDGTALDGDPEIVTFLVPLDPSDYSGRLS